MNHPFFAENKQMRAFIIQIHVININCITRMWYFSFHWVNYHLFFLYNIWKLRTKEGEWCRKIGRYFLINYFHFRNFKMKFFFLKENFEHLLISIFSNWDHKHLCSNFFWAVNKYSYCLTKIKNMHIFLSKLFLPISRFLTYKLLEKT